MDTGKVSSWAVKVSENELPACDKCYNALVRNMAEGTDRSDTCTKCFNWTLDQEAANQKIIPVDKDYPTRKEIKTMPMNQMDVSLDRLYWVR